MTTLIKSKRSHQTALNGMRGVHLAAAELATCGFAPVVTSRNTAFADILAQPLIFDGAPLAISVKYNANTNGNGSFFLLGKNPLPRNEKAFFVLVLNAAKDQPNRYWVVPSRTLALSPTTKATPGALRLSNAPKKYLGLHEGSWGYEVYFNQLKDFENAWDQLRVAAGG